MGVDNSKVEQVKTGISIPKYFYEIIIPEMPDYYSDYTVDFESKPVAKCPVHSEDTPSFRWYEETNTCFCFGCRVGGDIINLHRKFIYTINGVEPSFEEAVNFLYNYFIEGKESTAALTHKDIEAEQKSSTAEVLVFSEYVKRTQDRLLRDTSLPLERKEIIYRALDKAVLLASLNYINAIDAMKYVKEIFKKAINI